MGSEKPTMRKDAGIRPVGTDQTGSSSSSDEPTGSSRRDVDVSVLPPETTSALVESERDFLTDKIRNVGVTAEAVSAMTQRVERLEASVEEQSSLLRQRVRRLEANGVKQSSLLRQAINRLETKTEELQEILGRLRCVTEKLDSAQTRLEENVIRSLVSLHRPLRDIKARSVLGTLRHLPPRKIWRVAKDYRLLASSTLFDRDFYLAKYPDVLKAGFDPVLHYLVFGAAEGRVPGPDFDGVQYLASNPDVQKAGANPLVHFLRYGVFERRRLGSSSSSTGSLEEDALSVAQNKANEAPLIERGHSVESDPRLGSIAKSVPSQVPIETAELPQREFSQPVKSNPQLWHFVGDSIDWLKAHEQLTGVGRVSTELLLASFESAKSKRAIPCEFGESLSKLVAASGSKDYESLLHKLRIHSDSGPLALSSQLAGRGSPEPGEHIFFTGLVWTPTFTNLFNHLAQEKIEFSVLVFDIIPIESPDLVGEMAHRSFAEWLATTLTTASVVFVSSRLVKDQILRWSTLSGLSIKGEVAIIPFGLRRIDEALSREQLAKDPLTAKVHQGGFVLSVGTIDTRKNQIFLCKIWKKLAETVAFDNLPQLVLAGRDDLKITQGAPEFAGLVHAGKILALEGLPDRHLAGLYHACLFTAFPSISEGYGLPVAESLHYGKLCLSSSLPAIREHARDLVWYFSSDDLEEAVDLFARAIQEPEKRNAAELRISREFSPPKWKETYETMVAAAERTLCGPAVDVTPERHLPYFPGTSEVVPVDALTKAARWCRADDPDVSILIINRNAAPLTLECVRQIWANTDGYAYEIIIADNGSASSDVGKLRSLGSGVRLLELECNRFFGEANNIAAEVARGRYVCMLSNDAFVQPDWLTTLVEALEGNQDVGAVGPICLLPNGIIQEAAGRVDESGYPVRIGQGEKQPSGDILTARFVDYVSSAALLVPRDLFMETGGFDLAYEPTYYEDVDLCFKIQALGRNVLFCPDAKVVHIEGYSANNDPLAEPRRAALSDLNREKFVSRWGEYLRSRDRAVLTSIRPHIATPEQRPADLPCSKIHPTQTAVLYTPFGLTPGGGESYLLTMAAILAARYRVSVVTPHPYSSLRLQSLGRELNINLTALRLVAEEDFLKTPTPDLMVTLGNHIVPDVEGRGKANLYVCQFPFQMDAAQVHERRSLLDNYGNILVYSDYVRVHVYAGLSGHKLPPKPIMIVYPPVQQVRGGTTGKKDIILSVGRFFVGGHSKRQDALIETFKSIAFRFHQPVEFHLAGSSIPEPQHMDYLTQLMASAQGFPIHFHVNPPPEQLHRLYREAAVYWHGTGIGADLVTAPEKAEHFGISLVEAMSAEAVPFSLTAGGPREIITPGENGFLYESPEELAEVTLDLFATAATARRERLGRAAGHRAVEFSRENFARRINDLIDTLM
jgi:glycosyltransferase involved in cell wall biosynthesis